MDLWQVGVLLVVATAIAAFVTWRVCTPRGHTSSTSVDGKICGYCIWRYRNGAWEKLEDHTKPGHVPSAGPTSNDIPQPVNDYCVRVISKRME